MSGVIYVNGQKADNARYALPGGCENRASRLLADFVSRGGLKLEKGT
jgi:predicted rRNA methylase YqxC with S4 and FtsJ domains